MVIMSIYLIRVSSHLTNDISEGVPALVNLLSLNNEEIQVVTASVLCNISAQEEVCNALTDADAAPVLIKLLTSPVDDIQSRAAVVLSDMVGRDVIFMRGWSVLLFKSYSHVRYSLI